MDADSQKAVPFSACKVEAEITLSLLNIRRLSSRAFVIKCLHCRAVGEHPSTWLLQVCRPPLALVGPLFDGFLFDRACRTGGRADLWEKSLYLVVQLRESPFITQVYISIVPSLPFPLFEWQIQTNATSHTGAQSFEVSSNAASWPRHRRRNSQPSSPLVLWCQFGVSGS